MAEGTRFGEDLPPSSWEAVDMSNVDGAALEPTVGQRTDGAGLLYAGLVHGLIGESESLKSWVAQTIVAQVLEAGGSVLYIDLEDHAAGVKERLRGLGVDDEVLDDQERFRYIRPDDEPLTAGRGGQPTQHRDVLERHLERPWTLAVIDGVTESMTTERLDILDNGDVAQWMALLPKLVAHRTGAAVVTIDHVTKAKEGQGRYAIGGQHKLAGIDGAMLKVTIVKYLRRSIHDPTDGSARLTISKDRPGWLRGHLVGSDDVYAVFDIAAYPDGGITARFLPPTEATQPQPSWSLVGDILEYLAVYEGAGVNQIKGGVSGNDGDITMALRWLVDKMMIAVKPVGQKHAHSLTELGRDELEAHRQRKANRGRGASGRD
jgi:hypothetical protein